MKSKNTLLKITFPLLLVFVLWSNSSSGQLMVDGSLPLDSLAQLISGEGVQILNPQIDCGPGPVSPSEYRYGKYDATNTPLGITEGLLLTTGTLNNAIGPNNTGSKSTIWTSPYNGNPQTYPLLDSYTGHTTFQYCEFEFDIIPQGDTITFDFVFASEEYEEWVGSQYNDVFGFFISGPGIVPDAGAGIYKNIALVPGTSIPVTINDVNQNLNTAFYQNNDNDPLIQYDGYTRNLFAQSEVVPCETYHLILVIADASDKIYDSGVFIEKISSNNVFLLSSTAGNLPHMVEGCNDGTVTFKRPIGSPNIAPLTIQYWLDGTAINGTDYVQIGADPNPLIPKSIIIPAGQDSSDLPITTIADGISEPSEFIKVYLGNPYCSNVIQDSLTFFMQDSMFAAVSPPIDSICVGDSVQLMGTGGSIFSWSPPAGLDDPNIANPMATPASTTTYSLTTSASFCVEIETSTIYVSDINLNLATTNVDCHGNNNGAINLTVTNGLPPYTYSWTGPGSYTSSNEDLTGLIPGTYIVTVTDANGCMETANTTISEPQSLTSSVSASVYNGGYNVSCFGSFDGSITLTVNGGSTPFSFAWTGPNSFTSSSMNISALEAGSYNVIITDTNNCSTSNSIALTEPTVLDVTITNQIDVGCKGESTGSALTGVTGGTTPYTYLWNTSPVQVSPAAINLTAGTYLVTVTDDNICTDTVSVTITEPTDSLDASITSVTNVFCKGDATGSATVAPTGGTTPYTYLWNSSPTQNTATATGLPAGNYTVTVTDNKNCNVSLPVTITEPSLALSVSITNSINVLCKGDSTGLATAVASGGSGSFSYSWNTVPVETTTTISNLVAGNYIVSVIDNNGCATPATDNVNITEPAAVLSSSFSLSSYPGGFNISCFEANDGSINQSPVGGTSPYVHSWTGPNSFTSSNEDISSLETGTYYLLLTDDNLCTYVDSATITQPTEISVASVVTPASCGAFNDGAIGITVTGGIPGYTYAWVGPNSFSSSSEDISALEGGTYTLTATDAATCVKIVNIQVDQPGTLGLTSTSGSYIGGLNVSCNGAFDGSIDVTPSGGVLPYSYTWTGPNGFNDTLEDVSSLEAGVYHVILTDSNGCFTDETITITEPNAVDIAFSPVRYNGNFNISCNGAFDGEVIAVAIGGVPGYTYSWTGPNLFTSTADSISGLEAGTYILLVTDTNGCTAIDTVILTQPDTLIGGTSSSTYVGVNNISCYGLANGSIDLTVNGGSSPFMYSWTGPGAFTSINEDINNLIAGTYSVIITDGNGCIDSTSTALTEPDSLDLSTVLSSYAGGNNISCHGFSDGSVNLTVIGGTSPYSFNWSNSAVTEDLSNVQTGSYTVIVTDTNNCSASTMATLKQPQQLQTGITSPTYVGGNNVSCNGAFDGSVDLQVNGGVPAYSYSWIGPNSFASIVQDPAGLEAGTYQVTVSDSNGCIKVDFITLQAPSTLTINMNSPKFIGGFNLSCFNDTTGSIDVTVNGGNPTYNYSWSGPNSFGSIAEDITNLVAGNYVVTVVDTNGCISADSLVITEPLPLSSSSVLSTYNGGTNISCFGLSDGSIDITMNGGNSPYTFNWSGPNNFAAANQEDISSLVGGNYSVFVVDTNGCTYDTTITLVEPSAITDSLDVLTFIGGNNVSCNNSSDGAIDLFAFGGTSPYAVSWTGPNSFTSNSFNISGLESGAYNYTITDTNMCSLANNVTLNQPDSLLPNLTTNIFASGDNIACLGDTSGIIFLNVTGGNDGYMYSWTGPGSFTSNEQNPDSLFAGTYYLLVTDSNGCTANDSITLTQPTTLLTAFITPSVYPSGDNISCLGFNDGDLLVTITDGTPSYVIDWRGPNGYSNNTAFIDSLFAGTYDLVVNDSNECTVSLSIDLLEPDTALSFQSVVSSYPNGTNISCPGYNDGDIQITPVGGSPSYSYNWTSNISFTSNSQNISNILAGDYYLTLTDTNSCVTFDTIVVAEPNANTIIGSVSPAICGNQIGAINITTQGNGPFTFIWFNSNDSIIGNDSLISQLPGDVYTVEITDNSGCIDSNTYVIQDLNPVSIDLFSLTYIGGHSLSGYQTNDGSIQITVNGGLPPFDISITSPNGFSWTSPIGFSDFTLTLSELMAGDYVVVLQDANGCDIFSKISLTEPLPLEMPTGMTPNGDGANDFFFVRGLEIYPENEIHVFNRWGNEVFSQNDYKNDWQGISNGGSDLPEGTYFVILKIASYQIELKGFVDIRR